MQPRVDTVGSADSQLVGALASYLDTTRDRDAIRRVISEWSHDAAQRGVRPEQLLIQLKDVLRRLNTSQTAIELEKRLADQQELIAMCIEEYFSDRRQQQE